MKDKSGDTLDIVVIEKYPSIRESLVNIIKSHSGMNVMNDFDNTNKAIDFIDLHSPDVIVLEISLGGNDGLGFIKYVCSSAPDTQIIVFSRYDEKVYAARAIEAGASGYVRKKQPTSEVLHAIAAVSRGETYVDQKIVPQILSYLMSSENRTTFPLEKLTDRELEVCRKLGEGYNVDEIAAHLDLHSKTIETYRRRAKEKLGYSKVEDLLRHAVKNISCAVPDQAGQE